MHVRVLTFRDNYILFLTFLYTFSYFFLLTNFQITLIIKDRRKTNDEQQEPIQMTLNFYRYKKKQFSQKIFS